MSGLRYRACVTASALVLFAGCASGGMDARDAARERPPRPDASIAGDGGSVVGAPDAASALDASTIALDASSIDAGRATPDGGVATDAGTGAMGDAGSRCCASDADCSATEVCVVAEVGSPGVCEHAPRDRECWTDADCASGDGCGGARISACDDILARFDSPGRCR
jgi:hypothetical protein